ncbi:MAG: hypothetical protein F8N37_12035 [Telmatospirillum sp.]|nr:hypothetical protein [Telmatospirillum sp.]
MSCGGSGGGSSQNSQTTAQLDPQVKQAELDWYGNQQKIQQAAQGASLTKTQTGTDADGNPVYAYAAKPYTPYTGQKVAGLDPYTTAAEQGYQAGSYQPANTAGTVAATSAAGYQPSTVTAGSVAGTDLTPYLNPYTKSVTDATINDFTKASARNATASQAAATTQGAFGGSGQGVYQANEQDNLDRTLASTLAGLNQDNFKTALGTATSDLNRSLQAQGMNQQAGLTANGQRISAAGTLGALGQQAQAGQTADLTNGMAMGATNRDVTQQGLDWNYQNNFYNPNYMQPEWAVQLANGGQGNMPQAQTLSSSSGKGGSTSCGGSM